MPNKLIAERIAHGLRNGLIHPGDPANDLPPKNLVLPFRTVGMPKEMADLVNETVKAISEAVVAVIEEDHELVPRGEAVTMRAAIGGNPLPNAREVAVHCRCDKARKDPLMILTLGDEAVAIIDGKQLIKGLSMREIKCPHEVKP